jgi:hypothetical protein
VPKRPGMPVFSYLEQTSRPQYERSVAPCGSMGSFIQMGYLLHCTFTKTRLYNCEVLMHAIFDSSQSFAGVIVLMEARRSRIVSKSVVSSQPKK